MRFASGLIKEGKTLLHVITFIFIGAFSLNLICIWPLRHILDDNGYNYTLKGKFCKQINITSGLDAVEISMKPKLLIFAFACIFIGLGRFYYTSALKASKCYAIPKLSHNFMNIQLQYAFGNIHAAIVLLDQLKNTILQLFYDYFGQQLVFQLWWSMFVIENIGNFFIYILVFSNIYFEGIRFFFNLYSLVEAMRRWPEFEGYKPRTYPGQLSPRLPDIAPRRTNTPSIEPVEWKSRRISLRQNTVQFTKNIPD